MPPYPEREMEFTDGRVYLGLARCESVARNDNFTNRTNETRIGMRVLKAMFIAWVALAAALASARTFDEVRKSGKLIAATEGQYPPYNFFKGTKLTGFEVELAEAMAKKWGVTIEWKAISFDALLAGLKQDRWDLVIAGHAVTEERSKAVTFASPHFCGGGVIVTKDPALRTARQLAGKTISVQTGTTFLDEAKKVEGVKEVKNFPQDTDARSALMAGRTDAWVTDPSVARAAVQAQPGAGLHIGEMLFIERNAAAVAKGNNSMAEAFNRALSDLQADGTYVALSQKYFGADIRCK